MVFKFWSLSHLIDLSLSIKNAVAGEEGRLHLKITAHLFQVKLQTLRRSPLGRRRMAGEEGFEPSYDGFRARCLTAWLLPNILINKLLKTKPLCYLNLTRPS